MSKSKRRIIGSTAAAVALLAAGGTALAQDTATYDSQATDTHKMESAMDNGKTMAANSKEDAHRIAGTFGVSELNDIENWKITNNGQELGEIDRLGVDRETGELLAVVGLEGVVGVNMKEVAIPLKDLKKAGDETLSTTLTKEQLQKKRDIDPWDGSYSQVLKDSATQ